MSSSPLRVSLRTCSTWTNRVLTRLLAGGRADATHAWLLCLAALRAVSAEHFIVLAVVMVSAAREPSRRAGRTRAAEMRCESCACLLRVADRTRLHIVPPELTLWGRRVGVIAHVSPVCSGISTPSALSWPMTSWRNIATTGSHISSGRCAQACVVPPSSPSAS